MELPAQFKARMKQLLGPEYDDFIVSYAEPAVRGIRVNTLKISKERFLSICPWSTAQAETLDEGLVLLDEAEHIGTHPFHIAGLFYMQEPSAMSVIEESQIEPGMKVLDLCAAPGGKSGGIAARLKGEGLLVSNEIVPSRAKELARNLERLGVVNSVVTNAHPDAVAAALPHYFDRVIVDAPCSGEGMFRKDRTAVDEWSAEHVSACAQRQKAIIESAARCVKEGGKLIYSTCTFSHEENEEVIESFVSLHPDFTLESMRRLYPHRIKGEGHFSARLVRSSAGEIGPSELPNGKKSGGAGKERRSSVKRAVLKPLDIPSEAAADEFFRSTLNEAAPSFSQLRLYGEHLLYCPFDYPLQMLGLPVLSFGTEVGTVTAGYKKHFIKPAHAFFMAAHGFPYRFTLDFDAESKALRSFLGGESLEYAEPGADGCFLPVTVCGFPVGYGKAVNGTLKNHLPKGLQIGSYR